MGNRYDLLLLEDTHQQDWNWLVFAGTADATWHFAPFAINDLGTWL
jgi:hypothetical protein